MVREVLRSMILKADRTFDLIKQPNIMIGSTIPMVGAKGFVGHTMRHQFMVGMPPFEADGMVDPDLFTQKYLRPIGAAMMQRVNSENVRAFGVMGYDLPGVNWAVASDPESGMSVRLVRQYDVMRDQMLARFDCLAA